MLNGTLFAASTGRIDDRWRSFMEFQIARARQVCLHSSCSVHRAPCPAMRFAPHTQRARCRCVPLPNGAPLCARHLQTFAEAEAGVNLLDAEARWPVW